MQTPDDLSRRSLHSIVSFGDQAGHIANSFRPSFGGVQSNAASERHAPCLVFRKPVETHGFGFDDVRAIV